MKKDLFISHASEDKDDFVRPLAELLRRYGLGVWYDEFELRVGSSISRSIDKGIVGSNFGLIVLSTAFFSKNWTEYELKSLISFDVERKDFLLPVWKDVDVMEVREFSPYLADKFALVTKNGLESIAIKIIEIVKPELFAEINRKLAFEVMLATKEVKMAKRSDLMHGPIRHVILSESILSRIRLIRSSLWLGYQKSMEVWIDGFKRDLRVETEIRFWEHLAACFMEVVIQQEPIKAYLGNDDVYADLFKLLFSFGMFGEAGEAGTKFKADFVDTSKEIYRHSLPLYDINEANPFEN